METTEITITKITASEGKWLSPIENNPYQPVFSKEIFLGVNDSADNWQEVNDDTKSLAEQNAMELNRNRIELLNTSVDYDIH